MLMFSALLLLFLVKFGFCQLECTICVMGLTQLQKAVKANSTGTSAAGTFRNVCQLLPSKNLATCLHIVEAFQDEILFVLENSNVDPAVFCPLVFPNCTVPPASKEMWSIPLPEGKPKQLPWPRETGKSYRILHLTDIHIDYDYDEGSEADCGAGSNLGNIYWLCCRKNNSTEKVRSPAGKWGVPQVCDLPYRTFDSAMKHISQTYKDIDYIILTGDFEPHDPWNYNRQKTTSTIENVTATLLQYFPKIPIYCAVGNHEGVPQDAMAPHGIKDYVGRGPQWLYSALRKSWSNWLLPSTYDTIQYRASYSTCPRHGLRLISLNNIYCSALNFYVYMNQTDPDGTLEWLVNELAGAERRGEKVHIISHIPTGDDYCLKDWFQNTVAAQFFGHTHQDQFEIFYDSSQKPFHISWISPSLTTYYFNNPAYRIYTLDSKHHTVVDAETYRTDVEAANRNNEEPKWTLEYTFKEFYGLCDLSPSSLHGLSQKLLETSDLFRRYVEFYWRSDHDSSCYLDAGCHQKYICEIRSYRSHDPTQCATLGQ